MNYQPCTLVNYSDLGEQVKTKGGLDVQLHHQSPHTRLPDQGHGSIEQHVGHQGFFFGNPVVH